MRMGFANENLVAIAELGGDVVGHRHGHVPGHVQEGVYCVESLVPDNDDDDVGGNDSDGNGSDHYLRPHLCPRRQFPYLRPRRQFLFHCRCLVVWVLTIVPFQSPIHHRRICQRDDFQPPGRRDVGAELEVVGVGIVDEKTLAGSCSTVQLKEIGGKLYQQI